MKLKKALITGITGFVGPHLKRELEHNKYDVYGLALSDGGNKVFKCDITNSDRVLEVIQEIMPDCIFHLAGFSSVSKSFQQPDKCYKINVTGTKNLLDAVKKSGIRPRILIVSSAEVYGVPKYLPIDEKHPLNPISPYGKSRVEQEEIALKSGLPVIISRSFNHTGPGQSDSFVIPSFRKQIKEAKDGGTIYVGNLGVVRDFSDVRDVVKAYRILVEKGKEGDIYNVGSGIGYGLRDILDKLVMLSGKKLEIKKDISKIRKDDIPKLIADNGKVLALGGISFRNIF